MLQDYDPAFRLMPNDIRDRILSKYVSKAPPIHDDLAWNAFTDTPDVEHFISILEYQNKFGAAEIIRREYREAILKIAGSVSQTPPRQNLYSVLLDYQLNLANKHLGENLLGFVSFNYEDILENTISTFFRPVNYVFKHYRKAGAPVNVYKLHGSFNWINERPIKIRKMKNVGSKPSLWIPPGVDKKKDTYPFNLLWGQLTEELLKCDVLRVIGCSLSRNDWGIIPVLYTMRDFVERNGFDIEVIASPGTAENITRNYGYLNVKSMLEMEDVIDYFREELGNLKNDKELKKEISDSLSDREKGNPFRDWLLSKLYYLAQTLDVSIGTPDGIVSEFYSPS